MPFAIQQQIKEKSQQVVKLYQEGLHKQAVPIAVQVRKLTRQTYGENHPGYATSLNNLGELYLAMRAYTEAEPLFRQALEILRKTLGEDDPEYAYSLSNLSALYNEMGDYAAAEPLYRQALEISRKTLGKDHPDYANSLNNLAGLYRAMGNYAAAEPLVRQASDIFGTALGEDHPGYATSLNNLALLYRAMGNYAAAEPLVRQALEILRKVLGEHHPNYAGSLNSLAMLYIATGREAKALKLIQEAAAIDDRMIGQVFSIGSESQRLAYLATLQSKLHALLSLVTHYLSNSREAVQAGLELVLRRKAIAAEALAVQRDAVLGGHYPALQSKLRELITWRRQIAQKTLAGPGREGPEAHQKLLSEWISRRESLEEELVHQIPEMNLEQKLRAAERQAVAGALPPGTALVEFVNFDDYDFKAVPARGESQWKLARYLAFVLPAGEPDNVNLVDLGEAEPIDGMIAAFRAAAAGGERALTKEPKTVVQAARTASGAALRAAVFDRLLGLLGGRTRLLLAPDGDLSQLPFEALPLDDGQRLIDAYQISYVSTGRDVVRFTTATSVSPQRPVVLADPDFNLDAEGIEILADEQRPTGTQSRDLDRSRLRFTRLKGAQEEGEQVGDLLGVKPLIAQAALEGTLKDSRSPRILHLATTASSCPTSQSTLFMQWRA